MVTKNRQDDQAEIDQIRLLLVGEIQRENERRFAELDSKLDDFRQAMERQISQVAASATTSQATFIRNLGMAIAELGQHIVQLTEGSARNQSSHE